MTVAVKLTRRALFGWAAGAVAVPALPHLARAEVYPARPVRLISAFPAGGPNDIVARLVGQWLSERLGRPFVIDNRPGAGGNIGTEIAVRAAADGYTLLIVGPANAVNATLYDKLSFNFLRDIAPVAGIMRVANIMAVNPSIPVASVPEFIAYAKANPGKLNMGSAGIGASSHISGELFKMMTGVDLVHVPYRGAAPALTDLLAGQVQVIFDLLPNSIEHVRTGRLRALAITTTTRSELLPDVPTVNEFVPGYESSSVYGLGVPRHTPVEIIDLLNKGLNAGLADAKIKARLADLGGAALAQTPAEFGQLIAEETEKWGKVVKFAGAKAN